MTVEPAATDLPEPLIAETPAKTAAPALANLFNPAAMAKARAAFQPWSGNNAKQPRDLTPGPAPHGTRKAMGKR